MTPKVQNSLFLLLLLVNFVFCENSSDGIWTKEQLHYLKNLKREIGKFANYIPWNTSFPHWHIYPNPNRQASITPQCRCVLEKQELQIIKSLVWPGFHHSRLSSYHVHDVIDHLNNLRKSTNHFHVRNGNINVWFSSFLLSWSLPG